MEYLLLQKMSRKTFCLIMKYIRLDKKTTLERVKSESFSMVRDLWERLIENSIVCNCPSRFLTVLIV